MYRPWGRFPASGALPLAPQVCPALSSSRGLRAIAPADSSRLGVATFRIPCSRRRSKGGVSLGGFRRFAFRAAGLPGPFVVSRATGHRPCRFFAPRCRHVPDALPSQAIQGDEDSVFLVPRRFSAPCLSRRNPFPAFPGRYEDYVFCPCAFSVRPVSLCFITGFPQADQPGVFCRLAAAAPLTRRALGVMSRPAANPFPCAPAIPGA